MKSSGRKVALKFGKATHFNLRYKYLPEEVLVEVLTTRRRVRDKLCTSTNAGVGVWHAGEGPNSSDADRNVSIRDIYEVGLTGLRIMEDRINAAKGLVKSVPKLALECMGIDESDPSLSVPERCSLQLVSHSTTDCFFIDGSF